MAVLLGWNSPSTKVHDPGVCKSADGKMLIGLAKILRTGLGGVKLANELF
jgi:hypothetical protein